MKVTLIRWDAIQSLILPEKVSGKFWLTYRDHGVEEELIGIEGFQDEWILKTNPIARILDKNKKTTEEVVLKINSFYTISLKQTDEQALIFTEEITEDRQKFLKYLLPLKGILKLGKLEENDVYYQNPFISREHSEIEITSDKIIIRDLNSANGTFVNGKSIEQCELFPGDCINMMGLTIILGNNFIAMNNPDKKVTVNPKQLKKFPLPLENLSKQSKNDFKQTLYYRAPRFKRDIQKKTVRIDPPPNRTNVEEVPLLLMLGPSLTMGMTSLTMGLMAIQNVMNTGSSMTSALPTLMMSSSMLLGTILWPTLTKRHEKNQREKNEKKRQNKYLRYLAALDSQFHDEINNQSEIVNENYRPALERAKSILYLQTNLWERTIEQSDFLNIRLGLGNYPLNLELEYPKQQFSMEEDNLKTTLYELVEKQKLLENVPISLALKKEKNCGFIGFTQDLLDYFKNLLVQLMALHSYDELKFVFLYSDTMEEEFNFVKWLPHTWNADKTVRFIGRHAKEIKEISVFLEKEISGRQEMKEDQLSEIVPHYIIFSMDKTIAGQVEFIQRILQEKRHLGFTILAFYNDFNSLPKECTKVVEIRTGVAKIYDREDTSGTFQSFKPDLDLLDLETISKKLANISLGSISKNYYFPHLLNFLEMYGVGKIEHLNPLNRWKTNDPTKSLEALVGVSERGEGFKIDFHEKYHGPHGLVAGMTGSGKSEFIITFILSMAINYHPHEVAFILIDYKGGGMASTFEKLPHLAGTITNLDGGEVKRSLISIQSELNRRQEIFRETGNRLEMSNIDIYDYQKLYRDGLASEPLQHLFIISDEFAELKMQQPDFMDQLVSAARIGRSLGIHLILATQKPAGVVNDQIWSNSRLKICLKVQEKADSMDMIKRPDAAELKNTGRFYMQVGFNEFFDCGQSAWSGASYYPEEIVTKEIDDSIVVINRVGQVIKEVKLNKKEELLAKPKKQIDAIVDYIAELSKKDRILAQTLWLPPLPQIITYEAVIKKYKTRARCYYLAPLIGEYDDPVNQRQDVLRLEISRLGNTIVYGSPGAGKIEFLQTMLFSLISDHHAREVNLYILDFGSETLGAFKKAPQVGDVFFSYETEGIQNLFKLLSEEIAQRKRRFANYGGNYDAFIKKSEEKTPSILVVIENYTGFIENYESLEESLGQLTREGVKYGIYFIVTAISAGSVRYRIAQNFKQNFVLQLNDEADYSAILGNVNGIYPSHYLGRGIFKDEEIYEFQTATIDCESKDVFEFIHQFVKELKLKNTEGEAKKVPVLPEFVDQSYFEDDQIALSHFPVGVGKTSLEKLYVDFEKSMIFQILAQNISKSSVYNAMLEMLSFLEIRHLLDAYDENESIEEYESKITELFNTMVYRNNTYKDALEAGEVLPRFEKQLVMIRGLGNLLSMISFEFGEKLKLILEKGEKNYEILVILMDDESSNALYAYETWYKKHLTGEDGLWIGDGFTEQYSLKVKKTEREMYDEIGKGFGYLLEKGHGTCIKLVQPYKAVI